MSDTIYDALIAYLAQVGQPVDNDLARDVAERTLEIMLDTLGADEDEVTPQAALSGDLGADSIDYIDLVFEYGKRVGVDIDVGNLIPGGYASVRKAEVYDGRHMNSFIVSHPHILDTMNSEQLALFEQTRAAKDLANGVSVLGIAYVAYVDGYARGPEDREARMKGLRAATASR